MKALLLAFTASLVGLPVKAETVYLLIKSDKENGGMAYTLFQWNR